MYVPLLIHISLQHSFPSVKFHADRQLVNFEKTIPIVHHLATNKQIFVQKLAEKKICRHEIYFNIDVCSSVDKYIINNTISH